MAGSQPDNREARYPHFRLLGVIMDEGPLTLSEVKERLYPGGTTGGRGPRKGMQVPVNESGIRKKLEALVRQQQLERRADDKGVVRYRVHPDLGRVWVVYVGSERGYVGIYDTSLQPIPLRSDSSKFALRALPNLGEAARPDIRTALHRCLNTLADLVELADAETPGPRALVVGIPAAVNPDDSCIRGETLEHWVGGRHGPPVSGLIEEGWTRLQTRRSRRGCELPDLPRAADGTLALSADADVVFDTLGAMHDPARVGLTPRDPRRARVVLGVKHSVGVRSTVIARGDSDLHAHRESRRSAGVRRDSVYRGAFGDTIGLGHSIALVKRAHQQTQPSEDEEVGEADWVADAEWEPVTQYHERRVEEQRPCSCGIDDPPHLNQVASYSAVAERLRGAGLSIGPVDIWDGVNDEIARETRAGMRGRLILEETGRLLAYAIDNGVRLYDPEAIVVTGKMAFNDVFWNTVLMTARSQRSSRRALVRASDIPGDDVGRPIGLRGAAWVGFDTWVFPAVLDLAQS